MLLFLSLAILTIVLEKTGALAITMDERAKNFVWVIFDFASGGVRGCLYFVFACCGVCPLGS